MQKLVLSLSLIAIVGTPLAALGVNEVGFVAYSSTGRVGEVRIMDFEEGVNNNPINCGDRTYYYSDYAAKKITSGRPMV